MIVNADVKETFVKRSRIISEVRRFLDSRGYLEVETPALNTAASGANARPFITHHNSLDIDMYLRIALELREAMCSRRLDVYELGRVFRNEVWIHHITPNSQCLSCTKHILTTMV